MSLMVSDGDALIGTPDPQTATVRVFAKYQGAAQILVRRVVGEVEEPFRQMNPWIGDFAGGVRDYECPLDVPVFYRAYGYDDDGQGPRGARAAKGAARRQPCPRGSAAPGVWREEAEVLERERPEPLGPAGGLRHLALRRELARLSACARHC